MANNYRAQTAGDPHPSDLGDTFPAVQCRLATGAEILPMLEPVLTAYEPLAEANFADNLDQIAAGTINPATKEKRTACGDPQSGGGCLYEVTVTYITSALVDHGPGCPGGIVAGACLAEVGKPCTGSQVSKCHTFGSLFAATMFRSQIQTEIASLFANCGYVKGQTQPLLVSPIKTIPGEGAFGECEQVADIGNPLAQAGEITQPGVA